ncbi:mitochondrial inner membrane protein OXA1L [Tribolium castaneum]|uniref:mitochondrial inner membrane protein OXA1L n=1 Tax=Tribolium castaneum TaxID=7070 RepID=UPI0000D57920|nr:PREDICTED: mitochondrial inner membrane protein OXA1L [Tribolium castaneum]|eukprot:XP_968413.1 PREDICTED: mitochondrial inner membrane protein OXA1L [Tribolium castaneum]
MFNRTNLVSQYKAFARSLKGAQKIKPKYGATTVEKLDNSSAPPSSTPTYFEKNKGLVARSHLIKTWTTTISSIQDKFINKRNVFWASSGVAASSVVVEPIPEPPPVPPEAAETVSEIVSQVNALGEPTFASLGLGGKTPVGIAQTCFEYLHINLGVPWWEAIVIGTLVIRICLFPLVIIAQRNAAKMNNYMPQLQAIQLKMTEARQSGNQLEVARYSQELMIFMKEKQLNPLKNMIVPLAQMPVFVSFFMALREMSNVPIESLRTGGLWWFTDLTVPDQYFLMPLITSATLFATIELGTDTAKLSSQNLQTMKYVLRAVPVIVLPFTINFPGAILCYWVSSNFISLLQVGFLKIPKVRNFFKIEPMVTHKNLPMKPKGFTEGLKDSWTNLKITRELEERQRIDEMQFQKAGRGPIVKTYKYDPTKQTSSAISAKKR